MSELTLTIIKLGFLAVLWLFVLSIVSVIRADLFGTRVTHQRKEAEPVAPAARGNARPTKPPKPKKGEPKQVVVTDGPGAGLTRQLGDGPLTIGRGPDCEVHIDDEYVSTRHAVLTRTDDTWYVEDLGSTNGTFVGGSRIHRQTSLATGVQFRVGKTVLELKK